ncbi:hypothetical protein AJ79_03131 [Helicocarpus griseus UAMH5409]|uniref:Uncharacterized protein n=1 Tax=Helicocarpus griseus UAMH5409 TaxID=1447875 RepID=A0A2B7XZG5_9EURO|nr:hypothetical protein AJ79_03131 [Helicocarpus griseus UAMH5409]
MDPLAWTLCLVLLVGCLLGTPNSTSTPPAAGASISENPLLVATSFFDVAMPCPLVLSAVLSIAFVLLNLVPACVSMHERLSDNGPITVVKAVSIVRASLSGHCLLLRSTLSRAYRDSALGVARAAMNWAGRLYRWAAPSDDTLLLGVMISPFVIALGWFNFGAIACAYVSGFLRELSGLVARGEWEGWMERQLHSLEMFQLALFVALVALAFLPAFVDWMVARLTDFGYVIIQKPNRTAAKAAIASCAAKRAAKRAKAANPAGNSNGTTENRQSISGTALDAIVDQLNSRIRELEGSALASGSVIKALEGKVRQETRSLAKITRAHEELRPAYPEKDKRCKYLSEKLARSDAREVLKLTSSLESAQELLRQEEMRARIAEDQYRALRQLAGTVTEQGLHGHLHDFDKFAEQCTVDGVDSTTRKVRLEHMQQTLPKKLPYLLREASTKTLAGSECQHNEALIAHSSRIHELEVEVQAARRLAEDVRAGKDAEIASLRQELEASGRAIVKMEGELHDARCSVEALENAAKVSDSHDAATQTQVTGAELFHLQQQLESFATREVALCNDLAHCLERERQVREGLIAECRAALANKDAQYNQQIDQLRSEGFPALKSELEQLRAKATSAALADANAKVVERQAQVDYRTQRLNQVSQATPDDLSRQTIEALRTRVQALEKASQDHISEKVRSSQRIKSLEEDLQKATIASSKAKADALNKAKADASPIARKMGVNPLKAKVENLEKALVAKDAQLKAQRGEIEAHVSSLKAQKRETDALRGEIKFQRDEIKSLGAKVDRQQAEIESLRGRLSEDSTTGEGAPVPQAEESEELGPIVRKRVVDDEEAESGLLKREKLGWSFYQAPRA